MRQLREQHRWPHICTYSCATPAAVLRLRWFLLFAFYHEQSQPRLIRDLHLQSVVSSNCAFAQLHTCFLQWQLDFTLAATKQYILLRHWFCCLQNLEKIKLSLQSPKLLLQVGVSSSNYSLCSDEILYPSDRIIAVITNNTLTVFFPRFPFLLQCLFESCQPKSWLYHY